ncbi:MAG: PefC/AfrB family outer membrane usher protein [Acinetobacter sp.]
MQKLTIKLLKLPIMISCFSSSFIPNAAGENLDFSFIQGGGGERWQGVNSNYTSGDYLLDLYLNGSFLGKRVLTVTDDDTEDVCLPELWLIKAGVYLSAEYFKSVYNPQRQCYDIGKAPFSQQYFDVSTQTLELNIPQKGIIPQANNEQWEYGTSALRGIYNLNGNINEVETTIFGSTDLKANIGKWVISSLATATKESSSIDMFTANRALKDWKSDLSIGKTYVGNSLLGSIGLYGVTLSSNNSMVDNSGGYRPIFSGIAKTYARVTLTQTGSIIYSEMMPPGPFVINNVPLLNSGDVEMNVVERDGEIVKQVFPLTRMSGQINPRTHEYNASIGVNNGSDSQLTGPVGSLSYGYGYDYLTLRSGVILHDKYQGINIGAVSSLGRIGAVSLEGAYTQAKYDNGLIRNGGKIQVTYSKSLQKSSTSLQTSISRNLSEDYIEFSGFVPRERGENIINRQKNEVNAGISKNINSINLGFSGWRRDYWRSNKSEIGITGTLNSQIKNVSFNIGGGYSKSSNGEGNYTISASVSVPFSILERRYNSYTSLSTGSGGGYNINSGVSGSINDKLNYTISGGQQQDRDHQGALSGSYNGENAGVSMNINHSSRKTNGSLSISGSVLALPQQHHLIFSRVTSDTIAVVNVHNMPDIKLFSNINSTDSKGNVVIPLSNYQSNIITVDTINLPSDVELGVTSQNVMPTAQSVTWLPFDVIKVKRYILQIRFRNGEFVPSGTWAISKEGMALGFISTNGVLLINSIKPTLSDIQLGQCLILAKNIQHIDKVQEVTCEN